MDKIVLMMAECDLVAAEFLSDVEEFLASHPGAEETGLLLLAETLMTFWVDEMFEILWIFQIEARRSYVELHAQIVTELLQITRICLVMDILHPHMQRFDLESWVINLCALR
jgi:hypothetical protein